MNNIQNPHVGLEKSVFLSAALSAEVYPEAQVEWVSRSNEKRRCQVWAEGVLQTHGIGNSREKKGQQECQGRQREEGHQESVGTK